MDIKTLAFLYVILFISPALAWMVGVLGYHLIKYLIDLVKGK